MTTQYDGYLRFGTRLDNSGFERGVGSMTSTAKKGAKLAAAALATVTTGLGVMAAAAIKVGSDFEEGMSKVSAISGATGKDLEALTAKAAEMGAKTKFTATQSAEALQYMAMAGWKTEDMLNGLEGIMNLAAASGEDLGLVSDIVTDALTAFGLKAQDSAHFADVLAKASSNSNTNVAMMGQTFKYAAPIAGALGYSIEDTAVAIGLMANSGIKADQAGTSLRSMMTRLSAPPRMAAKAIDELNISIANADGTMKPFSQVMEELREKFAGMSEEQQVANAKALAGQEAMSGLLAIVNASPADFAKLTEAVNNADGATAQMAETMQDNLKGQITILSSTLEGLGITVYDKFEAPMRSAAKSAIESVNDLNTSMQSGQLSGSVDKLAEATGHFMARAAELATRALPKMITGLTWILDHGKLITATIGAATAAVVTFKAVNVLTKVTAAWKAASVVVTGYTAAMAANNAVSVTGRSIGILLASTMSAQELVVGVLTGKVTLATAAQVAWNAAMAANPIGLVVTAVSALTIGLMMYNHNQDETIQRTKELATAVQAEKDALQDRKKALDQQIESDTAQVESAKEALSALEKLTDANGKIIGDKEKAKALIDEINEVMPDSIQLINDETIAYQENAEALKHQMDLKEAQIVLDDMAAEKQKAHRAMEESLKRQTELQENLKQATQELTEAEKVFAQTGTDSAQSAVTAARKKVDAAKNLLQEEQNSFRDNAAIIDQYSQLRQAIASKDYEAISKALNGINQSWKDSTTAQQGELQAQLKQQQDIYALLCKEAEESGSEAVIALRDSMAEEIETTQSEMEKLTGSLGLAMIQGVTNGIESGKGPMQIAFSTALTTAVATGKRSIQSNSPSKLTARVLGLPMAQGVAVGIAAAASGVSDAMKRMVLGATDTAVKEVATEGDKLQQALVELSSGAMGVAKAKAKSYKDVGTIYVEEMTEGIKSHGDAAIKAVEDQVEAMLKAEEKAREKGEEELQKRIENTKNKNAKKQLQEQLKRLKEQNDEEVKQLKVFGNEQISAYTESIKEAAAEQIGSVEETVGALADEFQRKYDEIISRRDAMQEKLTSYGEPFELKNGKVKLADWDEQTAELNRYNDALTALKEKLQDKGLNENFLQEITKLGPKEGTLFAEELLRQSDGDFEVYVNGWSEKQELAREIAEQFYQDQLNTLEAEFAGKLNTSLAEVPETVEGIGKDAMRGFIDGMDSMMSSATSKAREIAQAVIRAYQEEFDIHSPSRKMKNLVGVPIAKGLGLGMDQGMHEVFEKMRQSVDYETGKLSAQVSSTANYNAVQQSNSSRVETYHSSSIIEKTPVIKLEGEIAAFARVMTPHIVTEIKRLGGSLIKGDGIHV